MLKQFSIEESNEGFLPMSHGVHISKDMCPRTHKERKSMDRIPYTSLCMRPDISHALSITSRYQVNPGEKHWMAVKNIF